MKKLVLIACLGLLFARASYAQLLFSEDFTGYTNGTLIGQSGWTQGGGAVFPSVDNTTPLTSAGYRGGGGSYMTMPGYGTAASRVFKAFTPTGVVASGNVYYVSFLVNFSAVTASSVAYTLALGDAAGSSANLCPKLYAKAGSTGTTFNIGISKQTTTLASITYGTTDFNLNQTYLVVEKYVFNTLGAGHDDAVYLWVNPSLSTEPDIAVAECKNDGITNTADLDFDNYQTPLGGVGSFIWNSRGATAPLGSVDGIRVSYGTSSALAWAYLSASTTAPLAGDYYIPQGTHAQGFATLAAACTALNTLGVAAPVRILIDGDLAETGANLLIKRLNSTATNTVTILPNTGASHTITITGCAIAGFDNSKSGLTIDSTNYVTIDGSNGSGSGLTFNMNDGTNGSMLINILGSSNVAVQNSILTFTAEPASNTGIEVQYATSKPVVDSLPSNNVTIQNVKIGSATLSPRYGVYSKGKAYPKFSTGMVLKNNTIYALGVGLSLNYFGAPSNVNEVSGNTLYLGSDTWITGYVEGIFFADCGGTVNVFNNKILSLNSNLGSGAAYAMIGLATMYGAQPGTILNIYDNFITGFKSNATYNNVMCGMWFEDGSTPLASGMTYPTVNLSFNTIYMNPTGSAAFVYGVARTDGWQGNITIKDNIIYNANGTATSFAEFFPNTGSTPGTFVSDNNDLYVTGSGFIGEFGATVDCSTLATWRTATAGDANSVSTLVNFVSSVSPFDLHLAGASNGDLNLSGTPISGITTDIDKEIRDLSKPYMGADEASIPLPVELTSFSASVTNNAVNLTWSTATELNNSGFGIERSMNKSDWTNVSFVNGSINSSSTKNYSFSDNTVTKAGTYYYRLKQMDLKGSFKYSNTVEVKFVSPTVFALNQNYPNPFNPSTVITYSIPKAANVRLLVYNAIGQVVSTLQNGFMEAGNYNISFNASNLSSGLYFYKLEAGQFSQTKKMMLLK